MWWSLTITKMLWKQLRKFVVFMAKVSLQTIKSVSVFQSFIFVIYHREMNPDQDTHLSFTKIHWENWWNAICTKEFENWHLASTYLNPQSAATRKKIYKSEQVGWLGSSQKYGIPHIYSDTTSYEAEKLPVSQENHKSNKKGILWKMFNAKGNGLMRMNLCSWP